MEKQSYISLLDLVLCFSDILDLVSPELVYHNKRVAYIAYNIALEMGLSSEESADIFLASLLHDCGAIYTKDDISLLKTEFRLESIDRHKHGYIGYLLLKTYKPFESIAWIVRYHHVYWSEYINMKEKVQIGSFIVHLADRIEVLINRDEEILGQVSYILYKINEEKGKMFLPEVVEAFERLAYKESFWLDIISNFSNSVMNLNLKVKTVYLDMKGMLEIAELFYKIIDFRSNFTSTHSIGVSSCAESLARDYGFNEKECEMMKIAGLIHDIGKLVIPKEILEKKGPLTYKELNIIKSHTYYSYGIFRFRSNNIEEIKTINEWAAFHHEHPDGSGYPFHLKGEELSMGSRIMGVSDVFTAITEDRPYRKGMKKEQAINVLRDMAQNSKLDSDIVNLLIDNYDSINNNRIKEQSKVYNDYIIFEELKLGDG